MWCADHLEEVRLLGTMMVICVWLWSVDLEAAKSTSTIHGIWVAMSGWLVVGPVSGATILIVSVWKKDHFIRKEGLSPTLAL